MKRNPMIPALGAVLMLPALAMAGDKAAKMDKMDANHDGTVTSAEHAAGAQQMFTAMDANKDGYVTAAEMDAHWAAKGKEGQADKMKLSSADKIKEIDTDGDGRISAAEHAAGSAKMFARMDTDGDGKLTAAELQAGHDRAMKQASNGM